MLIDVTLLARSIVASPIALRGAARLVVVRPHGLPLKQWRSFSCFAAATGPDQTGSPSRGFVVAPVDPEHSPSGEQETP
ncbi:hypothetical protein SAMN06265360_112177 [Haloechinothrix alba]|uniref:Uncharacterized protein n=1 Tax=Haloechinothrix alba TaxID=664784 RepID=A0A238XZH2_9PSEU|nr:hypothetical protein SAMN06265360_112177 [Haloechinothrix alba]